MKISLSYSTVEKTLELIKDLKNETLDVSELEKILDERDYNVE